MTIAVPHVDTNAALGTHIAAGQVMVACADLATSLDFFTGRLGFRIELIFPADAPTTAVISGYGVCLRLEKAASMTAMAPLVLRLLCDPSVSPRELSGPDGVKVLLVPAQSAIEVPPGTQEFVLSRNDDAGAWGAGRAGMQYRDLIPGRLGGRFVASQIRIPQGGKVPDYVHFHRVRFQMIFCKAGWVRVVYEDQGPPFVMGAGDCVLQPPQIRHRVLEASPGLEVVEISCPSVHDTIADHTMALPSPQHLPERLFSGQRFVRHIAGNAAWKPWRTGGSDANGYEACDVGIAAATANLADVEVVRSLRTPQPEKIARLTHSGELLFLFVLEGLLELDGDTANGVDARRHYQLRGGDSCVIPAGAAYSLRAGEGLCMLKVAL